MSPTRQPPAEQFSTLGNDVFFRLRSDIIASRFAPGAKLRLSDLRTAYGVGFSPLREALSRLTENRLVTAIGQRGFRVREASAEDITDISMVRKEVEGHALRLAIRNANDLWEAQLTAAGEALVALQRMGKKVAEDVWESRHREFHRALVSACNSPCLLHLHELLCDQFDRYRRLSAKSRLPNAPRWLMHMEILDAARAREADKAVALLEAHITEATQLIVMGLLAPSHRPSPRSATRRSIKTAPKAAPASPSRRPARRPSSADRA
ncbi:GntR family transcriptional regulator [Acidisphaera rubrifaciens]|uniref:Transcriptional regulator GntR n=1 Tax=Acidisphaera rubrifaciens HS-AP3 TaxID=1231350 RepID=A0A0D6P9B4_9PROT|nr:FCD domain-containing protein [Acidisphaera rubrifaciens]GAN77788.1 transcriptional regulator GntR [Acidisphaera rubrifaciens HS-AP3]